MATLKDVGALAGVSTATVSLAQDRGPINEKTRESVKKAVPQLNHFPSKIGRMLASGRSNDGGGGVAGPTGLGGRDPAAPVKGRGSRRGRAPRRKWVASDQKSKLSMFSAVKTVRSGSRMMPLLSAS